MKEEDEPTECNCWRGQFGCAAMILALGIAIALILYAAK